MSQDQYGEGAVEDDVYALHSMICCWKLMSNQMLTKNRITASYSQIWCLAS